MGTCTTKDKAAPNISKNEDAISNNYQNNTMLNACIDSYILSKESPDEITLTKHSTLIDNAFDYSVSHIKFE